MHKYRNINISTKRKRKKKSSTSLKETKKMWFLVFAKK